MRKINFRRLSAATLAVAATAALTLGTTSTEAWGEASAWDSTTNSNSGKTSAWDIAPTGKTSAWD